jgi:hypothetical protein
MKRGSTPHWSVPALRQTALLWQSGRGWLLLGASIVPLLLMEAIRVRALNQSGAVQDYSFPALIDAFRFVPWIAAAWALLVWRGEAWDQRHYHWSLPVRQSTHDLWRIAAGGFWLLLTTGLCVLLGALLALRAGQTEIFAAGPLFWVNFFTQALIFYLLASVLPLATRRPIELTVACIAAISAIALIGQWFRIRLIGQLFGLIVDGHLGLDNARNAGFMMESIQFGTEAPVMLAGYTIHASDWFLASGLWLGIPLAAVLLAARRRR